MALRTDLTERFGISYPIIQAPMGGGANTPELVANVCEAGALGSIAAAYLTPPQIAEICYQVRQRTSKPILLT